MNTIITGVSGFIGGDLMKLLSSDNHFMPLGLGRNMLTKTDNLFNVELTNEASVRSFIDTIINKKIEVHAFVHCASILADSNNNKDINLFNQNNLITEHVILIIKELKIKTLINLSTIGVYPNIDGEYFEHSIVKPSKNFECLYSLSKFCSEELFDFYLTEPACTVINLRLSQVFGDRMRQDRIFKIMENEMKQTNKISVWTNGERISNFVPISKVLDVITFFINHPIAGTYNVCGKNMSYKELAEKIIQINEYKNVEICLIDKGLPSKVLINGDKLEKLLNNHPM